MSEQPTEESDVDLDCEDLRDRHGNRVTPEYVQRALADILDENIAVAPSEVPPGRPSLSGWTDPLPTGDLPDTRSATQAGCGRC